MNVEFDLSALYFAPFIVGVGITRWCVNSNRKKRAMPVLSI